MTDQKSHDYPNNGCDQQAVTREELAAYNKRLEVPEHIRRDQDQINRAIMAYETARMGPQAKPKFILHIDGDHFHARPRATFADVVIVAAAGAAWFGLLFSLWVIFA